MPITVYSSEEEEPSADDTPEQEDESSSEEVEGETSTEDEALWIEFLSAYLNLVPDPSGLQLHSLVKSLGLEVEKEATVLAAVVDLVTRIQSDDMSELDEEEEGEEIEEGEEEEDSEEGDDDADADLSDTGLEEEDEEEDDAKEKVESDAELTDALDEILTDDGEPNTKPSPDDLALIDDGAPMTDQDRNLPLMTNDGDKISPAAPQDED